VIEPVLEHLAPDEEKAENHTIPMNASTSVIHSPMVMFHHLALSP
jgi:hypothetical protein